MAGKIYKLDRTGHGLLTEWKDKPEDIARGAQLFGELQKTGDALARLPSEKGNDGEIVKVFDPDAEYLALPQLVGG